MKEVERVSLGGYAFTLDQDAAALAESYLSELEQHYSAQEGGSEILEGIEERMAELLHEKCGRDGVASVSIIEGIIGILGRPEQIEAAEGDSPAQPAKDTAPKGDGPRRKLYRDLSNKVVAGVCSGLAAYSQWDVVLFRILFAAGTLAMLLPRWHHGSVTVRFLFPILYLILWIAMPAAKTVRQRWEQRGEDGTIQGIQQSIENGAREIDEAVRAVSNSKVGSEFGKIFEKLIGFFLLIIGFSGLFTGGVLSFGSGALTHSGWLSDSEGVLGLGKLYGEGMSSLYNYSPEIAMAVSQPWVQILLLMVVFLPFLGILYGSLRLLFGFKPPKWHPGLVIFILWLLSVIAAGILIITGLITTEWMTI